MGIAVLIMGQSGSGKSASMRNFKGNEIGVINVAGKPLPFKSDIKTINSDSYKQAEYTLQNCKVDTIVIDDSQYLMADEFMKRAKETGFQKFTDIGYNFWHLVNLVHSLPENKIVYFLQHTEISDSGREKAKTIGKLIDEKITLEGLFSIVLKTEIVDGHYYFTTQSNGLDTAKSPIGMFSDQLIDNDLKMVDQTIRKYYGLSEKEEHQKHLESKEDTNGKN